MMKKKLIFFDLDDTLLKRDKSVSENTIKVLKRLQEDGHKIIVDTARNKFSTMPLVDKLMPDYAIINAGGYIINRERVVIRNLLIDKELSRKLINELKEKVETISIQCDDVLYTNNNEDDSPLREVIDLNDFNGLDAYKILVKDLNLDEGRKIAEKYNLDFENYFGGSWSRFCNINATKAKALEFITKYEGKDLSDTIAFGDDYGDIAMLKTAGVGVAMSNALPDVKKATTYQCDDCDNDGVARFLDKYFNLGIYN